MESGLSENNPRRQPVWMVFVWIAVGLLGATISFALKSKFAPELLHPPTPQASPAPIQGRLGNANIVALGNNYLKGEILKDGTVRIVALQADPTKPLPLPLSEITGELLPPSADTVPITLKAKPFPGEDPTKPSRFVGKVPENLRDQWLGLTVGVPYEGKTQRVTFMAIGLMAWKVSFHGDVAMPKALADPNATGPTEAEKKLFLTPGGKYTKADIAANGNQVASQKYRGMMASHNMTPVKGDLICPITNTLANPQFPWIIGGKKYLFCCPPCVEEFVKKAKEHPKDIKAPDSYRKK